MGDGLEGARALQKMAMALHELVGVGGRNTYSWVKTCMNLVGLPGGAARLPQRPLGEDDTAELRRGLARLGITGRK